MILSSARLCGLFLTVGLFYLSQSISPAQAGAKDDDLFSVVDIGQLEYRFRDGDDLVAWDIRARIGGDYNKIALKSEGEYQLGANQFEAAEFQLLYQRLISDFFDLQIGLRHDVKPTPDRSFAVFGLTGLAPQWFEVDAAFFVSNKGKTSLRLEAEYDLLITQKLVLQPTAEINVAFADDDEIGVGSGLGDMTLGLRLRYEISREFAPYIGLNWERKFGNTADFARAEGEDDNDLSLVVGLKIFF